MADRVLLNFRIDHELAEGLKAVAVRDGVPQSEQVRRAIRRWLEDRKAIKAERPRPASRKRS
ncbi:MAG: ribbon-helix-helix protein, CopG family [Acidobacteria bacterium]|nr:ribbon-helix-helix protein, CopG family [Acidobacteriota bacterium]